ncbi:hypothetical protein, partial [Salmonella sp. s51228]|uniref:hypothetical protein n=1 Tax=Salmonella sp. s51228 TaxID=3159652 RepID=UPI00397EC943
MAEKVEPGKIFVGGLSWDSTKETLSTYFKKYGDVLDAVIMVDAQSRQPRGFGFVTFKDPASVKAAVDDGNHFLDGKKIDPKEAINKDHPASQHAKSSSIDKKAFVGGLPHGSNKDEISKYFSKFGSVS